jgi:hypothetical protein
LAASKLISVRCKDFLYLRVSKTDFLVGIVITGPYFLAIRFYSLLMLTNILAVEAMNQRMSKAAVYYSSDDSRTTYPRNRFNSSPANNWFAASGTTMQ